PLLKTLLFPGLATFRRAVPGGPRDTTDHAPGVLQQRTKNLCCGISRMVNFNTVAGCFLASALFAMVVGKVSNAVVDPHHLAKPALAVTDAAPEAASGAPAAVELPPISPKLAGASVDNGKALFAKLCFTCHTV